jgi:hypothetical protein
MRSRGEEEPTRIGNPPEIASGSPLIAQSSSNHDFFLQIALEIQRSIGKLESSNQTLCVTSESHGKQLEAVAEQLHTAKGAVKAFGWILSIFGAIGLLLLGTILTVILKHYNLL